MRCSRLGSRALLLTMAAAAAPVSAQTTYYVDHNCGQDSWTGTSPVCQAPNGPKSTIQAALNAAAAAGDQVVVHPGRYIENISFDGKNVAVRALNPSTNLPDPLDPLAASIIDGFASHAASSTADELRLGSGWMSPAANAARTAS